MTDVALDPALYRKQGYLYPFTIYDSEETQRLRELYWRLHALLPQGISTQAMDWWHGQDRELWEICVNPKILDLVEPILGTDFYLWGSQFFSKHPGDQKTTPWHQDAFFWPLSPHRSVTVWLALEDSDTGNGAMMVIPGTHCAGRIKHVETGSGTDVLDMRLESGTFNLDDAIHHELKAGQASLHDDNIVHGSGSNLSDRLRCGLTLRYSAGEVKADLSVWPFFKAYWVRGEDRWGHNPIGTPPTGFMTTYIQIAGAQP